MLVVWGQVAAQGGLRGVGECASSEGLRLHTDTLADRFYLGRLGRGPSKAVKLRGVRSKDGQAQ